MSPPSRRPSGFAATATAVAVVLGLTSAALAGALAQDDPGALVDAVVIDPAAGVDIETTLATVGLDAAWRSETGLHDITRAMTVIYTGDGQATVEAMLATVARLQASIDQHERVMAELRRAAVIVSASREHERDATIERNRATAHLQGVVALTQRVAVDLFAGSGESDEELLGVDGQELVQAQRTMELQGHTLDEMLARRDLAIERLDAAEIALAEATTDREAAELEHGRLTDESAVLVRERVRLDAELRTLLPVAAEAFVLADVARAPDLTPRAIDAYVRAELEMTDTNPGCRISWRTIAAVGGVEGAHGTYGGRSLTMAGRPDDDIVGLRLDGTEVDNFGDPVANIPDSDGGRWDGDTVFDRAVGPMQFIPDTWRRWGIDADGDGDANPQDLDDAALAAAGYLCGYGRHSSWDNWIASIFAYNHSPAYVNSVQARLTSMQRVSLPDVDGYELWPSRPWGTFVPLPIPEPEPEEGVEPGDVAVVSTGG